MELCIHDIYDNFWDLDVCTDSAYAPLFPRKERSLELRLLGVKYNLLVAEKYCSSNLAKVSQENEIVLIFAAVMMNVHSSLPLKLMVAL